MVATCHACTGGTYVRNKMEKLQAEAPHIVIGTPGEMLICETEDTFLQNGSKFLFWMKQMKC